MVTRVRELVPDVELCLLVPKFVTRRAVGLAAHRAHEARSTLIPGQCSVASAHQPVLTEP